MGNMDALSAFVEKRVPHILTVDWKRFLGSDDTVHVLELYPRVFTEPPAVPALNDPRQALLVYEPEPERDACGRACVIAAFGAIYPGQRQTYDLSLHLIQANRVVPGDPFLEMATRFTVKRPLISCNGHSFRGNRPP
jgi:hypothetical protein